MATQITPFDFNSNPVRVIDGEDHAWFVLSDITDALGFTRGRNAARILDDDEKGAHTVSTPGGDQEVITVNESGLYHLTLKSRKPAAKAFRKWVTAEVLPAIRKTGRYETPDGLTPAQQREIQNIVSRLAQRPGNTYASLYRGLKDHFQVGTYKDIPAEKFHLAKCFLMGVESMEGDWEPAPAAGQYHYPIETAKPRTMHLPHQTWLTDQALLDPEYQRPLQQLLNQLKRDGNDVTGAVKEYQALYTLVESRNSMLHNLRDMVEAGIMRGMRLDLMPA